MIGKDPVLRNDPVVERRSSSGVRRRPRIAAVAVSAVVAVVAIYLVIQFISHIIGALVGVAVVAGIVYLIARVLTRKHRTP